MTMKKKTTAAFTLIELLVVIAIIAVLASIALPVFSSVQTKGAQTKALSNGKQIALALRLYASDNNGTYPSYLVDADGTPTTNPPTAVSSSNDALCQLFPNYIKSEAIFWLSKSKWCSTGSPDEAQDSTLTVPSSETLKTGENEWAYVLGLNESSNPAVPLLADGFITGGETSHRYSKDQTIQGGVWKGVNAIVIRADSSGTVEKVNADLTIHGPNGSSGGTQGDIFTTANSSNGWLGTANTVVNPK
jgi:prepilin-type N-terminal cleavage/methylation domain-containing protein